MRQSSGTVLLLIAIVYLLIIFRLGSKKFNYLELSEQIALHTGGLSVSTHIDESAFQIEDYEEVNQYSFREKKQDLIFVLLGNYTFIVFFGSKYQSNV